MKYWPGAALAAALIAATAALVVILALAGWLAP